MHESGVIGQEGHMEYYKKKIIEMLDKADERRLKLIYYHIKALLGLK